LKKAWQKLLNSYSGFAGCRQGISELTAGAYGFGTLGLSGGASAGRVVVSAAALRFVWALGLSGQTDGFYDDKLLHGAAGYCSVNCLGFALSL